MKKLILLIAILLLGCEKEYHPRFEEYRFLDLEYTISVPQFDLERTVIFETGLVDGVMADTDSLHEALGLFIEADLESEYVGVFYDPIIYSITYKSNGEYNTVVAYKYADIPIELNNLLSEITKLI